MRAHTPQDAERVALTINSMLTEGGTGFHMDAAVLYSVVGEAVRAVGQNSDIYDLLEDNSMVQGCAPSDFIAIATTGWASPMSENYTPKKHPERKRVRLIVVTDSKVLASVVVMEDDLTDRTMTDSGLIGDTTSEGALNDSIIAFANRVTQITQAQTN
jgi:hypothetical protein